MRQAELWGGPIHDGDAVMDGAPAGGCAKNATRQERVGTCGVGGVGVAGGRRSCDDAA